MSLKPGERSLYRENGLAINSVQRKAGLNRAGCGGHALASGCCPGNPSHFNCLGLGGLFPLWIAIALCDFSDTSKCRKCDRRHFRTLLPEAWLP